ncbi:MAG: hypothetical protein L6R40_008561, partial [Gallowayella cf. fulva]
MSKNSNVDAIAIAIKDLETLVSARKELSQGISLDSGLKKLIEKCAKTLQKRHAKRRDGFSIGEEQHPRLVTLCDDILDIPEARGSIVRVLICEIQTAVEERSQQDKDGEATRTQRDVLGIWKTLQSEKIDNAAVSHAVLKALISLDKPNIEP